MAATYYNISENEMREFLEGQGFSQIKLPRTIELVFAKRVDQDDLPLSLRVFTGINPSGSSRAVGKDAIRVTLFMRTRQAIRFEDVPSNIIKLGGSKRVHRVENWKKNLQSRIDSWLDFMPKHKCKCGSPMVPRNGENGKFLGCSQYPNCKNTRSLKEK